MRRGVAGKQVCPVVRGSDSLATALLHPRGRSLRPRKGSLLLAVQSDGDAGQRIGRCRARRSGRLKGERCGCGGLRRTLARASRLYGPAAALGKDNTRWSNADTADACSCPRTRLLGRLVYVDRQALIFDRQLRKDRISRWRWFLGAWGVGTYRQDDTVDVRYEADGEMRLRHALPIVLVDDE